MSCAIPLSWVGQTDPGGTWPRDAGSMPHCRSGFALAGADDNQRSFKWKSAVCESLPGRQSTEEAGGGAPCAPLPAPAAAPENCPGNAWSCKLVQDSGGEPQKGRMKMVRSLFCSDFCQRLFLLCQDSLGTSRDCTRTYFPGLPSPGSAPHCFSIHV